MGAVVDHTRRWCLVVELLDGTVVARWHWMRLSGAAVADGWCLMMRPEVVAEATLFEGRLSLSLLPLEVVRAPACTSGCGVHPRH